MSVALIENSFLSNPFTLSFRPRPSRVRAVGRQVSISCRQSHDSTRKSSENQLQKLAMVAMAARLVAGLSGQRRRGLQPPELIIHVSDVFRRFFGSRRDDDDDY